jgi:hypothetical protein
MARMTLPVLSDAHLIATPEYPLRASALPKINECPASVFLQMSFWLPGDDDEGGGEAAQTGNLVHSAAAVYHRVPGDPLPQRTEAGLDALHEATKKFPAGDVRRAEKIFQAYAADPENSEATVVRVEQKVTFSIPCAPWDVTKQPVYIRGTLDQLRIDADGVPRVDDIKTGRKFYGEVALDHYMTQQAAYVLGAQAVWGKDFAQTIQPGALICTDGYFRPKDRGTGRHRVRFHHKWDLALIPLILQSVVTQVAAARMGALGFQPSVDACRWCEHKNFMNCTTFYTEHTS